MQYCSSQHQTLLLPPDTSTTKYCFYCGSASLFLLKLFLCSSPVAYWTPTDQDSVHLSVSYLFSFSYCSWGSQGKNAKVVCNSETQGKADVAAQTWRHSWGIVPSFSTDFSLFLLTPSTDWIRSNHITEYNTLYSAFTDLNVNITLKRERFDEGEKGQ